MDICLRVLNESNKSRFDSYSVRNSVLIISYIIFRGCRVHILIFPTSFLEIAVLETRNGVVNNAINGNAFLLGSVGREVLEIFTSILRHLQTGRHYQNPQSLTREEKEEEESVDSSTNLVPRAFPSKNGFLREKPWGRGCSLTLLKTLSSCYMSFDGDVFRSLHATYFTLK